MSTSASLNAENSFSPARFESAAVVPYTATANGASDTLSWTIAQSCTTNGGVGPLSGSGDSFGSTTDTIAKRSYTAQGGQATVNASGNASGAAQQIQYYVAGDTIANADVTSRLETLYQKTGLPTPTLLAQIAVVESSYRQFGTPVDYGISGHWPTESGGDGGGHIGLMQVETSMSLAFDWLANTGAGYSTLATGPA